MQRYPLRQWIVALLFVNTLPLVGCSSGVDGKYYNSATGEFAMELKGGKVIEMQGQEGRPMTYEIRDDSLVIHDGRHGFADQMTFGMEKDGTLSLGPLGSLTKDRK